MSFQAATASTLASSVESGTTTSKSQALSGRASSRARLPKSQISFGAQT